MNYLVWLARGDAAELRGHAAEAKSSFLTAAALMVDEERYEPAARLARYVLHTDPVCTKAIMLLGMIHNSEAVYPAA